MEQKKGRGARPRQKKRLIELISEHPDLTAGKFTTEFTRGHYARLWLHIARECNSIPGGVKKTWRQWRKTWQDLRSYAKRKSRTQVEVEDYKFDPTSLQKLPPAERKALGLNILCEDSQTLKQNDDYLLLVKEQDEFDDTEPSMEPLMDLDSPTEDKVFATSLDTMPDSKNNVQNSSHKCELSCELLTKHEQKRLEVKQEYLDFKKEYLSQKLLLLKEQTEALKSIARALHEKK